MEQRISIDRLEQAVNLFGSFDENIRLIEEEFSVTVVNRDGELRVTGEPEDTMLAVKAINALLALSARQLSSYGGSLETAVIDLEHYRNTGTAVLVLCGGEVRAQNLLRLLEERSIPAVLDLKGAAMPRPGESGRR